MSSLFQPNFDGYEPAPGKLTSSPITLMRTGRVRQRQVDSTDLSVQKWASVVQGDAPPFARAGTNLSPAQLSTDLGRANLSRIVNSCTGKILHRLRELIREERLPRPRRRAEEHHTRFLPGHHLLDLIAVVLRRFLFLSTLRAPIAPGLTGRLLKEAFGPRSAKTIEVWPRGEQLDFPPGKMAFHVRAHAGVRLLVRGAQRLDVRMLEVCLFADVARNGGGGFIENTPATSRSTDSGMP